MLEGVVFSLIGPVNTANAVSEDAYLRGERGENAITDGQALAIVSTVAIISKFGGAFLGKGVTAVANTVTKAITKDVANAIPTRMARAIPAVFAGGPRLGAPGANEVWVTAAGDLSGLTTADGVASRLTLVDSAGNLIPGPWAIIEFDVVTEGLASPVLRQGTPGFVGGGLTAGGAREFLIPNLDIGKLSNVNVRIVP